MFWGRYIVHITSMLFVSDVYCNVHERPYWVLLPTLRRFPWRHLVQYYTHWYNNIVVYIIAFIIRAAPGREENRNDQWMGVSVASQGTKSGKAVVCCKIHIWYTLIMILLITMRYTLWTRNIYMYICIQLHHCNLWSFVGMRTQIQNNGCIIQLGPGNLYEYDQLPRRRHALRALCR